MLDADGIEALSMRKLGARLNAGATSLYRHVATKDELMEVAVDEVFAEIAVPPAGADWRAAVTAAAGSFRATALRHPWLASVLGQAGLAYLGPHLMAYTERLAALFTAAGFPEPRGAIDTVLSYVIGMSTTEAAWLTTVARSGQSWRRPTTTISPTPTRRPTRRSTPSPSGPGSSTTAWTSSWTASLCACPAETGALRAAWDPQDPSGAGQKLWQ
jgi:AcrR family transcriptional regulator